MAPRPSAPFALTAPMLGRLLFVCAVALPLSGCMDAAVTSAEVGASAAKSAQNGPAALEKANAAAATLATRLPVEPPEPKP